MVVGVLVMVAWAPEADSSRGGAVAGFGFCVTVCVGCGFPRRVWGATFLDTSCCFSIVTEFAALRLQAVENARLGLVLTF